MTAATLGPSSGDGASAREGHDRIAAETAAVLGIQVATVLLRYVGALFLTRALGASWFGSFTLAATLTTVLTMVGTMGVVPGLLPALSRARRSDSPEPAIGVARAAWGVTMVASAPLALLVMMGGSWLARGLFGDAVLATVLPPLGVFVLLTAVAKASSGLVQGLHGAHRQALVDPLIPAAVTVLGNACTWWFDWGLTGAVASLLLGAAAGLGVGTRWVTAVLPDVLRFRSHRARADMGELLRDSWPLMGSSTLTFVLAWMDVLLMGLFREPGEVGVYSICSRLTLTILMVNEATGPVLLARLSDHFAAQDWPAVRHLFRVTARWSCWAGAGLAGALVVWRRQLTGLFGPEFVEGSDVLVLLACGRLFAASTGLGGRVLAVTGRARLNMISVLLMLACNGILDVLWIPRHGGIGAAAATCVSIVVVKVLQTLAVWKLYRLHPFSARALAALPLVGLLAAGAMALDTDHSDLWPVAMVLFGTACTLSYVVFGADSSDRLLLQRLRRFFLG